MGDGRPYYYVLALISAIGEMIPMVGPILSAIPAILAAPSVSPGLAIGVAVFFILQQQLENTVLVPKIWAAGRSERGQRDHRPRHRQPVARRRRRHSVRAHGRDRAGALWRARGARRVATS